MVAFKVGKGKARSIELVGQISYQLQARGSMVYSLYVVYFQRYTSSVQPKVQDHQPRNAKKLYQLTRKYFPKTLVYAAHKNCSLVGSLYRVMCRLLQTAWISAVPPLRSGNTGPLTCRGLCPGRPCTPPSCDSRSPTSTPAYSPSQVRTLTQTGPAVSGLTL